MAPRKKVGDAGVPPVRQQNTDDRRRTREQRDVTARIEANRRHLAVKGTVMPQGGRHRKAEATGTAAQRAEEKKPRGKRRG